MDYKKLTAALVSSIILVVLFVGIVFGLTYVINLVELYIGELAVGILFGVGFVGWLTYSFYKQ